MLGRFFQVFAGPGALERWETGSRRMEEAFFRFLRERFAVPGCPESGPGDDAAVWHAVGRWVVATDTVAQGTDFLLSEVTGQQIGHKALAVNLSDVAAMGAWPQAALVNLLLPRSEALRWAKQIQHGVARLAGQYQMRIVGGDVTTWEGPLAVSITVLGRLPPCQKAWSRHGAQVGDQLLVSGPLGGSILGRHLRPPQRVRAAWELRRVAQVHAAIDLSDSLTKDLWRVCQASGVGAVVELARVPVHPDAHRLQRLRPQDGSALEHALYDGEDFELLVALSPEDAQRVCRLRPGGVQWYPVGWIQAHRRLEALTRQGSRKPLPVRGYEH